MATPEETSRALRACRERIDKVDLRILDLLNERTSIVQEIGRIKSEGHLAIYEPRREDEVFANVTSNNSGPLTDDGLRRIFERIIDEMRKIQKDRMEKNV